MEIKSFIIKNFRSIKNSGICNLSGDNITIIAGMNESGKTAILEALEDFNTDKEIRKEAIPLHEEEALPVIAITFEIDKETLHEIFNKINLENKVAKSINIEIIKKYPNEYSLSKNSIKEIGIKDDPLIKNKEKEIENLYEQFNHLRLELALVGGDWTELNLEDTTKFKSLLEKYQNDIQPHLPNIAEIEKRNEIGQKLKGLINKVTELIKLPLVEERFISELKKWTPNFILFSSFDDIFPSEVPLNEAPNHDLIKDLNIISDLNLEVITSGSIPRKMKHKDELNVQLKQDYGEFWTQDLTSLHIDWDSNNLYFYIKEEDEYFPPDKRSKGKQWHLAFYIRVSARASEDVPNIMLIDEPGLYLHAKAQRDVLNKLEALSEDTEIIFSTHSPYLIDIDKLNRIRLNLRSKAKGSYILNKFHKGADKETLTPIITAIGLDLSMGLDIAKDNNILLEGISDYYYLSAFKELLNFQFKKEVNFIPSVGADKFHFLVPLMMGWGLNYCVVLDNDKKGRQVKKKLLEEFGATDIKIIHASENMDEEIEDLFKREDFIKYVLNEKSNGIPTDKKNSQIMKQPDNKYDKALLSKSFFEKIKTEGISLSTVTKENFKSFLKKINEEMFPKS